jgi:hypothetical protein
MIQLLIDVAGWLGVVMVLAAYGLVSARRLEGDAVLYQALNIGGAALLIANSFYYGAMPSVAVNVIWIGIGVYALARRGRR